MLYASVMVVGEKIIFMGPAGPKIKYDCAGESQQQFTLPIDLLARLEP
jgi:hypothetical protein